MQLLAFAPLFYVERQFIILPAIINADANVTTPQGTINNNGFRCNIGSQVRVFDTNDWSFKYEFDPGSKGSKVPPPIVKLIGGNDTGGATLTQPKAGWDNLALGPIFLIRNQPPPPSRSTSGKAQGTAAKSNKGAMIGGVIGGICVVALVVGILIFFRKKRQEASQAQPGAELQGTDYRTEMQVADLRTEMQGVGLRAELQGNYNHPSPHELHAYEPPEMSVAAGQHYIR